MYIFIANHGPIIQAQLCVFGVCVRAQYYSCATAPSLFLLQVHYDGWSHVYDEWMDSDHPDIHPAGWCEATGHPLKVAPRDTKTQQPHGSNYFSQNWKFIFCKNVIIMNYS